MKSYREKRSISGLAALVLLGVFAAGILSVLLSGASAYRRITERDAESYDSRTCVQYLATKVRQAPSAESITLTAFGDGDSLRITETIEGDAYMTQIYCHGGWLMELFTLAEAGLAPEDGEKVLPAESLKLSAEDGLLQIVAVDGNGQEHTVFLALRGGEEAAP